MWSIPKIGAVAEVASGDVTVAEPAGIAQGDLMVACIAYRDSAAFTVPGDWTICGTQQSSGDTDATNGIASGLMMYCIRGASAPTLTFTRTGGNLALARIIAYSGGASVGIFDTASANTLASNSATVTTGTITTDEDDELLVAMVSCGDNLTTSAFDAATGATVASGATDTTNAPTANTWRERADSGSGTGADGALAIADAVVANAGPTGTVQATVSASARHVMIVAAFKIFATPIATAQAGNWSSTSTWVGGVVPGDGDTVTMNHNVTVTDNRTIGASGATGTAAITMTTANRVLTIATGATLTLRGDFIYKGQFTVYAKSLTMQAGSALVFDSSAAAAPSTTYYRCRPDAGGTGASISIEGTAGSRCSVSSVSGSGNGYFDRNGFASIGQFFAEYCDFLRVGDGTRLFYDIFHGSNGVTGTQSVTLHFNSFDACGQLNAQNAANSGCNHSITNNTWKNTAHATRCVALPSFTVAGTKDFTGNVCDKDVFVGDGAWDLTDTQFHESYTITTRGTPAIQVGILMRKTSQPTTNLAGDISDSLILKDGTFTNPHGVSMASWDRVFTIEDCVLVHTGTAVNGDAISGGNPASAREHIVRGNVMVPLPGTGESWGKFISMGGGANIAYRVTHNTYPSNNTGSGAEIATSYGETYAGHAVIYPGFKDNLAFSPTANRAVVLLRYTGTVQLTTGADTTNNGTWNGYSGSDGTGYHSHSAGTIFSGTAPSGHVNVTSDPFVDRTRTIASWDAALGGPGTTANAMAELAKRNDADWDSNYTVAALVTYLREGFKLTGAAGASFAGAASDGGDIGAMPSDVLPGAVSFAGAATFDAVGGLGSEGAVGYDGAATFAAAAAVTRAGAVEYAGVATMNAEPTISRSGVVGYTGVGAFTTSATAARAGVVAFSGAATFASAGAISRSGVVAYAGAATFAAEGTTSSTLSGVVAFAGAGTSSFAATAARIGAVAYAGSATFAAAGTKSSATGGAVDYQGAGVVSFAATASRVGVVALTGAATFAANGSVTRAGAVTYTGAATFASAATKSTSTGGAVAYTGAAVFAATATAARVGEVVFDGSATFAATATLATAGAVAFAASSTFAAAGFTVAPLSSPLFGQLVIRPALGGALETRPALTPLRSRLLPSD